MRERTPAGVLDIRSIMTASFAVVLAQGVVMAYLAATSKTYPGFDLWTLASSVFSPLGHFLVSTRGLFLPDSLSIFLANALFVSCLALLCRGLDAFTSNGKHTALDVGPLAVFLVLLSYFLFISENLAIRIILISLFLGLYSARAAIVSWKRFPAVLGGHSSILTFSFAVYAVEHLVRLGLTPLTQVSGGDFLKAGTFQGIFLLIFLVTYVFIFLGLIVANHQRVEKDLKDAEKDLLETNAQLKNEMREHRKTSGVLDFERKQLLSIFDATDEMVYVSDPETHEILYMNQATARFFPLAGRGKCHEVFQGLDHPCEFCTNPLIFGVNLGKSHTWEFRNPYTGRWYRCLDKAIRWPDGRMVRYEMAVDVHDRRQAAEELKQSKEAAEAASRAKSDFLAHMSHEIRTPMTTIIGMTELALGTDLTPAQRDYLAPALDSARSLFSLLNDILDLSKIEARKLALVDEDFALKDLLEGTVRTLSFQAGEKGLKLFLDLDPNVPGFLRGDPHRLRQVLVNLLGNAIKFTWAGSVSLKVEKPAPPPGEADSRTLLAFSIADTGIGIPDDKLASIFESFTQGEDFSTRRYQGTGLGLSICRELVGMMGGTLGVQSERGKGSTFSFTARFAPGQRPAGEAPHGPDQASLPPLDILLVEDNRVMSRMFGMMLSDQGHRPVLAESGQEALDALASRPFDLVLMDVQMPGMDGMETTRRIRASQTGNPAVPIIALTAHSLKGDRERFLEAGMNDYVSKPVDMEELTRVLRRVLKSA